MTEGPYKLPEGWRWVRLGEVCEIIMGQSPPSTTYNTEGEGLPFFQGKADFGELQPTPRVWCRVPQKIAEVGDILISVRAPVGPTNLVREKCCIGRGLAALRPKGPVETMWLFYHLRSVEDELATRGSGSTFNAITKRQLDNLETPLPPLEEQRRIVARIEELMARVREAKRLRQQAKEDTERLMQAVLAEVFPRPGTEPPTGWRWVRLGEVAREIRSGFAFRKKNSQEGSILHLRPYNIGDDGELQLVQQFLVPITALPSGWSSLKLKPGDILFNNTNSVELVGKSALVREELEAAFSNHITLVRVDPILCESAWLALSLNALWRQGFLAQRCNKWIGQAGYNTEMLRKTPIPLPPLEEQRRIVAHLEAVQEKVKALKEAQAATDAALQRLEQAVLDRAFRGEL